jgi:hypothetical protein
MRWKFGLLAVAVGAWGCSGKFEVGQMDPSPGGSAPTGGTSEGGTGVVGVGGSVMTAGFPTAAGGTDAGPGGPVDEFGEMCVPLGQPAPLAGPFATPAEVWSRAALFIWADPGHAPPTALPKATTYEWAGEIVAQAFVQARADQSAPGASWFVQNWLNPTDIALQLGAPWDALLVQNQSAASVLLTTPIGTQRYGIFSEPDWLRNHRTISTRGAEILRRMLAQPVPPPPPDIQLPEPTGEVSDREWLMGATRSTPVCIGCHTYIDPPGFALGNFDSEGEYRSVDHGKPVDATGTLPLRLKMISFDGVLDLGEQLVGTCDANIGLADAILNVALDQTTGVAREAVFDENAERIRQAFVHSNRTYEDLVRAYLQSPIGLRP